MENDFEGNFKQNGALNARVLLLNQSYEPIAICNVKKAIILLFLEKAELVSDNQSLALHSARQVLPWPSVIRLNNYIKLPYKDIILTRKNILRRDKHKCGYCGRSDLPLTIDHIIPKSRGGRDTWDNLVAACLLCNNKKGDKTPDESDLSLRIKPYRPNYIMFIINSVSRLDENWKPFLYQS